jgi:hypothetical protein
MPSSYHYLPIYQKVLTQIMLTQSKNKLSTACNLTAFTHSLTGPVGQPFASRHEGPKFNTQRGHLCGTGIFLLALSCYISDPGVIDHCGLVGGGLRPAPSLGHRANNVIIPLDLTQLFSPSFTLAGSHPSGYTTDIVAAGGEPCGQPAISLHSHTVLLI